jgi:hypothetical protein
MRHRVADAGNRAPSSIWRAINGCRTPSERDQIHVPDQDAGLSRFGSENDQIKSDAALGQCSCRIASIALIQI